MNKRELVDRVGRSAGEGPLSTSRVVRSLVKTIREALRQGDRVSLSGLGTFKVKARKGRLGRNPMTGESMMIAAGRKISFRPSLSLRRLIKG